MWQYTQMHTNENSQNIHLANTLGSAAFADNILCPTNTIQNLKVQAQKLTLYSDQATLIISGSKTNVTGILHSQPPQDTNGITPLLNNLYIEYTNNLMNQ